LFLSLLPPRTIKEYPVLIFIGNLAAVENQEKCLQEKVLVLLNAFERRRLSF